MRISYISFFFALLLSASLAFQGQWNSDYGTNNAVGLGAYWYICVNNATNRMQGTYSNIGYVDGTVSTNSQGLLQFNGAFYEAGYTGAPLAADIDDGGYSGVIQLILSADGSFFNGSWAYGSNLIPPSGYWAAQTVVNRNPPSQAQCWQAADGLTGAVGGSRWTINTGINSGATWDICVPASVPIYSSYQFPDGTKGASFGQCTQNAICQFNFAETDPTGAVNQGQWLVRQVDANTMYAFGWTGFPNTAITQWFTTDPNIFGSYTWNLQTAAVNCQVNQNYINQYFLSTPSSATLLRPIAVLLAAMLVLFML